MKNIFGQKLKKAAINAGIPPSVAAAAATAAGMGADAQQRKVGKNNPTPQNWSLGGVAGAIIGPNIRGALSSTSAWVWYVAYIGLFVLVIASSVYLYTKVIESRAGTRAKTALVPLALKASQVLSVSSNQAKQLANRANNASKIVQEAAQSTQKIINDLKYQLSLINNMNSANAQKLIKKINYFTQMKMDELGELGTLWQHTSNLQRSLLPAAANFTRVVANSTSRVAPQLLNRPPNQTRSMLRNATTLAVSAAAGPIGGGAARLLLG
jgi:hypothetical protein